VFWAAYLHCVIDCRDEQILLMNSEIGDSLAVKHTTDFLGELILSAGVASSSAETIEWGRRDNGIHITHNSLVRHFCWHSKGDYFAAVTADGMLTYDTGTFVVNRVLSVSGSGVYIHQLSKARSQVGTDVPSRVCALSVRMCLQIPFRKVKGQVQRVLFHPYKPLFFIAVSSSTS
jgi:hypothetical protein